MEPLSHSLALSSPLHFILSKVTMIQAYFMLQICSLMEIFECVRLYYFQSDLLNPAITCSVTNSLTVNVCLPLWV